MIEQQGRIDFVIRTGRKNTKAGVLFEVKRNLNKTEMIRKNDVNRKALHELILHFMKERELDNTDIRHVVICTEFEFYIFDASVFERIFYGDINFYTDFIDWSAGHKTDNTNDFFYNEIVSPFVEKSDTKLEATYIDIRPIFKSANSAKQTKALVQLFKLLGPHFLLRSPLNNDSNSLNKEFYSELLHIIGLEETNLGSKRIIQRVEKSRRNDGSLLENAIGQLRYKDDFHFPEIILQYGTNIDERAFGIGLELCLTWINRILFLKLLEAQIVNFHSKDSSYKFLSTNLISDFDDLSDLFFRVLAFDPADRPSVIQCKYAKVPYLNSSLFEETPLEKVLRINELNNSFELPLFNKTVLKKENGKKRTGTLNGLSYIFQFLDAYDFGAMADEDTQEESKTIINASVLGLIFEKINGYKDGAIFTPGYVTMYMAKKVIEKTVLEAFSRRYPSWHLNDLEDLKNNITDRSRRSILKLNKIIDDLKICDPAVGSGHFLVSCLNEIIAIKSRIGILADRKGNRLIDYSVNVDNDELITVRSTDDHVFAYAVIDDHVPQTLQRVQETLFHEKQKIIENCLFGVDINPNSVKICQLRLWIELLKNAYYQEDGEGHLETLPNIDINIKLGNSILSRTALDETLSNAFKRSKLNVTEYKMLVQNYRDTRSRSEKRALLEKLDSVKGVFQEDVLNKITKDVNVQISKLEFQRAQTELFSSDDSDAEAKEKLLDKISEKIASLSAKREKILNQEAFREAFEWRFQFPEVLHDDGRYLGFDVVISNPPYGVSIAKEVREHITKQLGKVPDYEIYYLFLNLAEKILKDCGNFSQIVPNTILFNHHAQKYRQRIINDWADLSIDDLTQYSIFNGVVVRNVIINAQKSEKKGNVLYKRTGVDKNAEYYLYKVPSITSRETLLNNLKNWGLVFRLDEETTELVNKIGSQPKRLMDYFERISQGLIAYDTHKGQPKETIKGRIFHSKIQSPTNSPWLKGEDVQRYRVQWNGEEYIEYGNELANPRNPDFFRKNRILVREITNPRIFAAQCSEVMYNDPAIINILASEDNEFPLYALLGILNSKLGTFFHFNSSPKATKGAFPKILVKDLNDFPLPDLSKNEHSISILAKNSLELVTMLGSHPINEDIKELDRLVDHRVYDLYGLLEQERQHVEKSVRSW